MTVLCAPPDAELIQPLEPCPPSLTAGELEDCLVELVRVALPADNARKDELRRQIEQLDSSGRK